MSRVSSEQEECNLHFSLKSYTGSGYLYSFFPYRVSFIIKQKIDHHMVPSVALGKYRGLRPKTFFSARALLPVSSVNMIVITSV